MYPCKKNSFIHWQAFIFSSATVLVKENRRVFLSIYFNSHLVLQYMYLMCCTSLHTNNTSSFIFVSACAAFKMLFVLENLSCYLKNITDLEEIVVFAVVVVGWAYFQLTQCKIDISIWIKCVWCQSKWIRLPTFHPEFIFFSPSFLNDVYHFRLHVDFFFVLSFRNNFIDWFWKEKQWIFVTVPGYFISFSSYFSSISNGNFLLEQPSQPFSTNSTLKPKNVPFGWQDFKQINEKRKEETRFKSTRRFHEQKHLFISINIFYTLLYTLYTI